MSILLGIYGTPTFRQVLNTSHSTYPFSEIIDWDEINGWDVLSVVIKACQVCDIIYFVLDDIIFPLNTSASYTCGELHFILNNKQIQSKTIFILKGNELSDEEFNEWLEINQK